MTRAQAEEIATLINRRNQLPLDYTSDDILRKAPNYEYEIRDSKLIACVERKKVQWYQWEIRHLSVHEDWEGQGVGYAVYSRAETSAHAGGACLLQCTIRDGNDDSERFFQRQGFRRVGGFANASTGNAVGVWQKVLRPPAGPTGEHPAQGMAR